MKRKRIVEFDIDRYLRNSKRLDLSHLDWADIPNYPLTDGDVMCLHYMMDIETHTVICATCSPRARRAASCRLVPGARRPA
jgi:hypothetical protein